MGFLRLFTRGIDKLSKNGEMLHPLGTSGIWVKNRLKMWTLEKLLFARLAIIELAIIGIS
jgi:hypothetical protein